MALASERVKLSEAGEAKARQILTRYLDKEAALLPVLHVAQDEFGWISPECVLYVASLLDLAPSKVDSALTFYTMFHRKPVGKYVIYVCRTLICSAVGAKKVLEYLKKKLGIGVGETTSDGRFTIEEAECLGLCDVAPVMMINHEPYDRLTEKRVDEILASLP
jgi:NADH-quinone oxidoreductase subunit E